MFINDLSEFLEIHFTLAELQALGAEFGIDLKELPGEWRKSDKARELVLYLEWAGRLNELVEHLATLRPHDFIATNFFPLTILLNQEFDFSEIGALCQRLSINLDALKGHSNREKTWELVRYAQRHGLESELSTVCQDLRPKNWILETYTSPPPEPERTKLRLDTALPNQVQQYCSFELAVAIRLPDSPQLQEEELDKTRSGDLKIEWPADAASIGLRVHVSAPECDIEEESHAFRLHWGEDSPVFYFQLTPQQAGRIGIVVTVYQEQEWLGGARLHTVAQEQVAGKVETSIISQPLTGIPFQVQREVATLIATYFDMSEINTQLCAQLNVVYEDVRGETRSEKAWELVQYVVRNGRFPHLIQECQRQRPNVNWQELTGIIPTPQPPTNKPTN